MTKKPKRQPVKRSRKKRIVDIGLKAYRDKLREQEPSKRTKGLGTFVIRPELAEQYLTNYEAALRRSLHQSTHRTIDLVPKVEWPT